MKALPSLCVDADPDPNLYFDADPDHDPDRHSNDADPNVDPTPSFTHVGNEYGIFVLVLVTAFPVYNVLPSSSTSKMSQLPLFWTAY
jgi:hypothetical protein